MLLSELKEKINSIRPWDMLKPIIEESSSRIIELNQDQMSQGKKSDGANTRQYSPKYLQYKVKLPTYKASPYADFLKTGEFRNNMYVKVLDEGIEIGSTSTEKEAELEERDGKNIYGLSSTAKLELIPEWANKLSTNIINHIKK